MAQIVDGQVKAINDAYLKGLDDDVPEVTATPKRSHTAPKAKSRKVPRK